MYKRKVLKLGKSSYVVTIPSEWILKNKIDNNTELIINICKNTLIINKAEPKLEKEKTLNFNIPLKILTKKIVSSYLKNYKNIIIKGENIYKKIDLIKQILNKTNLLQIYSINNNEIVLKDLSNLEKIDIIKLIKTISDLISLLFEKLCSKEIEFNILKEIDENINKLSHLCFKYLNNNLENLNNKEVVANAINYWRIINSLENIGDILKRIGRYLKYEENIIPEYKTIFSDTKDHFLNVINSINKLNDDNILSEFLDKKQSILKEIEQLKENINTNNKINLVILQLLKDILGNIETIIVSIIDLS